MVYGDTVTVDTSDRFGQILGNTEDIAAEHSDAGALGYEQAMFSLTPGKGHSSILMARQAHREGAPTSSSSNGSGMQTRSTARTMGEMSWQTSQVLNKITAIENQMTALINETRAIQEDRIQLEEQMAETQEQIDAVQEDLGEVNSAIASLEQSNADLAEQADGEGGLVEQLADANQRVEDADDAIEDVQEQIDDVQEQIDNAEAIINDPYASDQNYEDAQAQLMEGEKTMEALKEELEQRLQERFEAVQTRDQIAAQLAEVRRQQEANQEKLEELRQQQVDLQEQLDALNSLKGEQTAQHSTLVAQENANIATLNTLSEQHSELVGQVGDPNDPAYDPDIYQDLIMRKAALDSSIQALEDQAAYQDALGIALEQNADGASDSTIMRSLDSSFRDRHSAVLTERYKGEMQDSPLWQDAGSYTGSTESLDDQLRSQNPTRTARSVDGDFQKPAEQDGMGISDADFASIAENFFAATLNDIDDNNIDGVMFAETDLEDTGPGVTLG